MPPQNPRTTGATDSVVELVRQEVARRGPVRFDEVMELALYHPEHGFYATGGQAGRRGDYLTSPEVGPLFGAVLARAIDAWWSELGRPDPFVVIEGGAGRGALAQSVLLADPVCAPALRYLLVERSAALRTRQREHLTLTPAALALGPTVEDVDGTRRPVRAGEGPVVVSLEELPDIDGPVTVIANELLDNLRCRILERGEHGWLELCVATDLGRLDHPPGEQLCRDPLRERLVPLIDGRLDSRDLDRLVADAPPGARIPWQEQARQWLGAALATAGPGGRVVVIDYAVPSTAQLALRPQREWLRTYAEHEPGGLALERLGQQDITVEVCIDQLSLVRRPEEDRTQTEFLRSHGLEALVAEGQERWQDRVSIGDLQAVRGRSRVAEAAALTDPGGLGSFRVLEWMG